ncbi:aminotransferase class V-fold PLP-dependent enzyme [Myxococcota bacterium]|nr:aminotransferase class V-fold PLP-dependent enzyme [Myxococcota bacterium]MBU1495607.1 aminotransferase class V-fold PLP-dependent enzyme [Myxococcota bacterium]
MIYLNNAAVAWPIPEKVRNRINSVLAKPPMIERSTVSGESISSGCRKLISSILNCLPEEVSLIPGVTYGLNMAILGLGLTSGDTVVTSRWEHNSVLRPLFKLKSEKAIQIGFIESNGNSIDLDSFNYLIKNFKVSAIILSSASNVTGSASGWQEIFKTARENGIVTILDASQTFGIEVIPSDWELADIIVAPSHKAVRSIPGIAFIRIKKLLKLNQVFTGGTGIYSQLTEHPVFIPLRYEAGTQSYLALEAFEEALLRVIDSCQQNMETIHGLRSFFFNRLKRFDFIKLFSPEKSPTGIISFNVSGFEPSEVGDILRENLNLVCRTGLHCAPLVHNTIGAGDTGTVRLSLSEFNTRDEIEIVLSELEKFRQ